MTVLLSAEFTFCTFDRLPIEVSPIYKELVETLGERRAERWTYTELIPVITRPPPGEGGQDDRNTNVYMGAS